MSTRLPEVLRHPPKSGLWTSDGSPTSFHTSLGGMAAVETQPGSVEAMRRVLAYLSEERHQLQARGAGPAELEANGKAIAAMQAQLFNALARATVEG